MNAEYLLEAVGLIDDDLIAGAMEAPARQTAPRPRLRRWAALAACLALAAALGRFALPDMRNGTVSGDAAGDAAFGSVLAIGNSSHSYGGLALTFTQLDELGLSPAGLLAWLRGQVPQVPDWVLRLLLTASGR